jgi:anti-sigma B factor antagonist
MISLRCLRCGLSLPLAGSRADFCPRCLARGGQKVQLIQVSDRPAAASGARGSRLRIETRQSGGVCRLALEGEIDVDSGPALEEAVAEICASGASEIVLDMKGVEFIDSCGLSAILRARAACADQGCSLRMTPAQEPAQHALAVMGVAETLQGGA